jgi:hypothetical protein
LIARQNGWRTRISMISKSNSRWQRGDEMKFGGPMAALKVFKVSARVGVVHLCQVLPTVMPF